MLGVEYAMDSSIMNDTDPSLQHPIEYFTALKFLCTHLPLSSPWEITDILLSTALPFPGCHIIGIISM